MFNMSCTGATKCESVTFHGVQAMFNTTVAFTNVASIKNWYFYFDTFSCAGDSSKNKTNISASMSTNEWNQTVWSFDLTQLGTYKISNQTADLAHNFNLSYTMVPQLLVDFNGTEVFLNQTIFNMPLQPSLDQYLKIYTLLNPNATNGDQFEYVLNTSSSFGNSTY